MFSTPLTNFLQKREVRIYIQRKLCFFYSTISKYNIDYAISFFIRKENIPFFSVFWQSENSDKAKKFWQSEISDIDSEKSELFPRFILTYFFCQICMLHSLFHYISIRSKYFTASILSNKYCLQKYSNKCIFIIYLFLFFQYGNTIFLLDGNVKLGFTLIKYILHR